MPWYEYYDENYAKYWYNSTTNESVWECPPDLYHPDNPDDPDYAEYYDENGEYYEMQHATIQKIPAGRTERLLKTTEDGETTPEGSPKQSKQAPAITQPTSQAQQSNAANLSQGNSINPPSTTVAGLHAKQSVYKSGKAHLTHTKIGDAADLGLGTQLYFVLLDKLFVLFCRLTLLVVPNMLINLGGSRIDEADVDAFSFSLFTVGNRGVVCDPSKEIYEVNTCEYDACESNGETTCVFGTSYNSYVLSFLLTAAEIVQIVLIILFIHGTLKSDIQKLKSNRSIYLASVAPYSVLVRGLPNDVNADELGDFFSSKYDLSRRHKVYPILGMSSDGAIKVLVASVVFFAFLVLLATYTISTFVDFLIVLGLTLISGGSSWLVGKHYKFGSPVYEPTPQEQYEELRDGVKEYRRKMKADYMKLSVSAAGGHKVTPTNAAEMGERRSSTKSSFAQSPSKKKLKLKKGKVYVADPDDSAGDRENKATENPANAWEECKDLFDDRSYYFNHVTNQTTYERPTAFEYLIKTFESSSSKSGGGGVRRLHLNKPIMAPTSAEGADSSWWVKTSLTDNINKFVFDVNVVKKHGDMIRSFREKRALLNQMTKQRGIVVALKMKAQELELKLTAKHNETNNNASIHISNAHADAHAHADANPDANANVTDNDAPNTNANAIVDTATPTPDDPTTNKSIETDPDLQALKVQKERAIQKLATLKKLVENVTWSVLTSHNPAKVAEITGAFVTFEHCESARRCLRDYRYAGWPFVMHYLPECRRFTRINKVSGKLESFNIFVSRASEPSEIKWENLEFTRKHKAVQRFKINSATILLLFMSFVTIYVAYQLNFNASKNLPLFSKCTTELPAVYYATYDFPKDVELLRNRTKDSECPNKEFYISFDDAAINELLEAGNLPSITLSDESTITRTSFESSQTSQGNPVFCDDSFCIPQESSTKECATLSCVPGFLDAGSGAETDCEPYARSLPASCYCYQSMTKAMQLHGYSLWTMLRLRDEEGDLCETIFVSYLLTSSITLAVSMVVVSINYLLNSVIPRMCSDEYHTSSSGQAIVTFVKISLAQIINTALTTVIVNARINFGGAITSLIPATSEDQKFSSFSSDWYRVVGVSITVTLLANALSPHFLLFATLAAARITRWVVVKRKVINNQFQLDKLFLGPVFNTQIRLSFTLTTTFVTLIFSGGIPLLLPIASASLFVLRWVDWYTILRISPFPQSYDERLLEKFRIFLKAALILHIFVTAIMFSETELFQSDSLFDSTALRDETGLRRLTTSSDSYHLFDRIARTNSIPLFFIGFVYCLTTLANQILPLSRANQALTYVLKRMRRKKVEVKSVSKWYAPGFSGLYHAQLTDEQSACVLETGDLNEADKKRGCILSSKGHVVNRIDLKSKRLLSTQQVAKEDKLLYTFDITFNTAYKHEVEFISSCLDYFKTVVKNEASQEIESSNILKEQMATLKMEMYKKLCLADTKKVEAINERKAVITKQAGKNLLGAMKLRVERTRAETISAKLNHAQIGRVQSNFKAYLAVQRVQRVANKAEDELVTLHCKAALKSILDNICGVQMPLSSLSLNQIKDYEAREVVLRKQSVKRLKQVTDNFELDLKIKSACYETMSNIVSTIVERDNKVALDNALQKQFTLSEGINDERTQLKRMRTRLLLDFESRNRRRNAALKIQHMTRKRLMVLKLRSIRRDVAASKVNEYIETYFDKQRVVTRELALKKRYDAAESSADANVSMIHILEDQLKAKAGEYLSMSGDAEEKRGLLEKTLKLNFEAASKAKEIELLKISEERIASERKSKLVMVADLENKFKNEAAKELERERELAISKAFAISTENKARFAAAEEDHRRNITEASNKVAELQSLLSSQELKLASALEESEAARMEREDVLSKAFEIIQQIRSRGETLSLNMLKQSEEAKQHESATALEDAKKLADALALDDTKLVTAMEEAKEGAKQMEAMYSTKLVKAEARLVNAEREFNQMKVRLGSKVDTVSAANLDLKRTLDAKIKSEVEVTRIGAEEGKANEMREHFDAMTDRLRVAAEEHQEKTRKELEEQKNVMEERREADGRKLEDLGRMLSELISLSPVKEKRSAEVEVEEELSRGSAALAMAAASEAESQRLITEAKMDQLEEDHKQIIEALNNELLRMSSELPKVEEERKRVGEEHKNALYLLQDELEQVRANIPSVNDAEAQRLLTEGRIELLETEHKNNIETLNNELLRMTSEFPKVEEEHKRVREGHQKALAKLQDDAILATILNKQSLETETKRASDEYKTVLDQLQEELKLVRSSMPQAEQNEIELKRALKRIVLLKQKEHEVALINRQELDDNKRLLQENEDKLEAAALGHESTEKSLASTEKLVLTMEEEREAQEEKFSQVNAQLVARGKGLKVANAEMVKLREEAVSQEKQREVERNKFDRALVQLRKHTRDVVEIQEEANAAKREAAAMKSELRREQMARRQAYNALQDIQGKIRVMVRCRPMIEEERRGNRSNKVAVKVIDDVSMEMMTSNRGPMAFRFDKVMGMKVDQVEVFEKVKGLVGSVVDGFNVTIFAYGQTSSGKTYTMAGPPSNQCSSASVGIIPRSITELFSLLDKKRGAEEECTNTYEVKAYFMELYLNNLIDLFALTAAGAEATLESGGGASSSKKLEIKMDAKKMVYVKGAVILDVEDAEDMISLWVEGDMNRHSASTNMNTRSSRSHTILTLTASTTSLTTGLQTTGKLSLIDLAGSERVSKSGVDGINLKEMVCINKSLAALGDVIGALSNETKFVPFRNNKLTQLMQDSLGGNSKTLMIVSISPSEYNRDETIMSLHYASRAKMIKNVSTKNDVGVVDEVDQLRGIIEGLMREKQEWIRKMEGEGGGGGIVEDACGGMMEKGGVEREEEEDEDVLGEIATQGPG